MIFIKTIHQNKDKKAVFNEHINIEYLMERREIFITFKQLKTIKHPIHSATTQISLLLTFVSLRNSK